MTSAKASDDLNQVIGIVCGRRSEIQHVIVACALALDPDAVRGVPNHRIEPIDAANDLEEDLADSVIAFHVCQFMRQDKAAPLRGPLRSGGRQEDRVTAHAPRHRRDFGITKEKAYRPFEGKRAG